MIYSYIYVCGLREEMDAFQWEKKNPSIMVSSN